MTVQYIREDMAIAFGATAEEREKMGGNPDIELDEFPSNWIYFSRYLQFAGEEEKEEYFAETDCKFLPRKFLISLDENSHLVDMESGEEGEGELGGAQLALCRWIRGLKPELTHDQAATLALVMTSSDPWCTFVDVYAESSFGPLRSYEEEFDQELTHLMSGLPFKLGAADEYDLSTLWCWYYAVGDAEGEPDASPPDLDYCYNDYDRDYWVTGFCVCVVKDEENK